MFGKSKTLVTKKKLIFLIIAFALIIVSKITRTENEILAVISGIAGVVLAAIGAMINNSKTNKVYLVIILLMFALLLLYPYFF
jgi:intracellular septation protein A